MVENKTKESQEQEKKKKEKKVEEELPFCTTATSAEHARADDSGEPCDDFRSGDVDED
ncbi:MAG: hypothetical protein SV775_04455 [Thermodesulfobacteriota bacterium]|nr:hypothetical protein [Thermodesulfobacteriota bacterium]